MIGLLIFIAGLICVVTYFAWYGTRPDPSRWIAVANADIGFDANCYRRAADKLGLKIRLRAPVPCPGIAMCGGMRGIYLAREQADKESALSDEYFNQKRRYE